MTKECLVNGPSVTVEAKTPPPPPLGAGQDEIARLKPTEAKGDAVTTAIFIDGPLAREVMVLPPEIGFEYRVPLPRRVTNCYCDDFSQAVIEPEVFVYHRIMQSCTGDDVALFSKRERGGDILTALKEWVTTDLRTSRLLTTCRDRRAYE